MNVFITGGTRGIGLAIAQKLAPNVQRMTILARDEGRLVAVAKDISKGGTTVNTIQADLADIAQSTRTVSEWAANQSSLDLVVLDAGTYTEGALLDLPVGDFERDLRINLLANVALVQLLVPLLREGRHPRIVLIGSTAAYEDYPLVPSYGVAKWALRSFASNLRLELRADRIGVSFISPGGTLTDMWEGEEMEPNRLLEASDVAAVVAASLMLSEQAVVEEVIVRPILGDMHE